jgi:hypothetical protein
MVLCLVVCRAREKRVPVVQKIFASYLVRMNLKGVEAPVLPYTI